MNRVFVDLFLIIYIISPFILIFLFGILIIYGGRAAEGIGAGIFAIIIFGHIIALVITVRARKHSRFIHICLDTILLIFQLMFTIIGIIVGIVNASDDSFKCSVVNASVENYNISSETTTTTASYNRDYSTIEVQGGCAANIFLFVFSIIILYMRCWILPAMEKLRKHRRRRTSENNERTRNNHSRITQETDFGGTLSDVSQIFTEVELSPPPIFSTPASYPPLPPYEFVSGRENYPPPPYTP